MTTVKRESFVLSKLSKPIFLNMFSIADDEWRSEQWTKEEQSAALVNMEPKIFMPLLWRAIDDEGKRLIANVKIVKWDGFKEEPMHFDTPEEKLKHIFCGAKEIIGAWKALLLTLKMSIPDEMANLEKKSSEVESSVTQKSST